MFFRDRLLSLTDLLRWCELCTARSASTPDQRRTAWCEAAVVVFCQHLRSMDEQSRRAGLLENLFQNNRTGPDNVSVGLPMDDNMLLFMLLQD